MSKGEPTSEKLVQDYTSKWYKQRYSGTGFLYHSRIVTDMLQGVRMADRHSDKVLDVGCGRGLNGSLIRATRDWSGSRLIGMDINKNALEFCEEKRHDKKDPNIDLFFLHYSSF